MGKDYAIDSYKCPVWHDCFTCPLPKCLMDYTENERPAILGRAKRIPYVISVRRHTAEGMDHTDAVRAAAVEHGRSPTSIHKALSDAIRDGWTIPEEVV